jgi:Holliday junction resolvase RusA-like endonuclease
MTQINPPILELDLPLAPSINNLYATIRGRRVLSEEGESYKNRVAWILRRGFTHELIPPKTNLHFAATFYIPQSIFYKRDLDNCLKCTIDSIFQFFKEMGSSVNDNRITEINVCKKVADKEDVEGSCNIEISIAGEAIR